ncbi:MAG: hypothetical protein A2381_08405 [Bdellovibrionales bacterium RIFOXYB1_FULL_37_110]|nr:MAG: hypothetical protein A2417_14080 [Bdellovibrionales bacterium RIFOXYC1_FULL_37_79]OFZ52990.1 MAG: hypothetical protein A2328_09955 [Bdellovibrionales bacterium RIFOXYB2_FULL_36_6]OFZ58229.1 MAG: hypothetical protein A2381_08405 [Bdellovibrionales bacterium RIFOXYB1_FULL_37_110]OFZ62298.1 MAG: hypothetical protein A2577_17130 [Bdellovibrionales bacterium RIFOXYD1_FULL_36_51]
MKLVLILTLLALSLHTIANEQPSDKIASDPSTKTTQTEEPLNIADDSEDRSLTYEPISIDGKYTEKTSQADRMKNLRAKLEKQNELLVKRKIESLRLRQEMKMTKKLQKIFNQQMQAIESIN